MKDETIHDGTIVVSPSHHSSLPPHHHMHHALALARRGLGNVWPNPAVGAVIVSLLPEGEEITVAQGWTQAGGRPHAETVAIEAAGERARGATLYVTLEPCAHTGHTPPCTQAIINAGIRTVVIACRDPDPRVNGKGIAQLKDAGIEVIEGICREEAEVLNAGFFSRLQQGSPWVTLKLATSIDGKIARADGTSKWITNSHSRARGHLLRATHDAIFTGIGTVLADDPLLTCRLPGLTHRSPVRVVMDRALRIPLESQLVRTARTVPLWIITSTEADALASTILEKAGAILIRTDGSCRAALSALAERGITRVLAECGQTLATALLEEECVDTIHWFRAEEHVGEHGISAIYMHDINDLTKSLGWKSTQSFIIGEDKLTILQKHRYIEECTNA